MELPEIDKRYILIIAVVLLIAAAALLFLPSLFSQKTVNAYFSTSKLAPGQNTSLIVEVTNTLGKDVSSVMISVSPLNRGIIGSLVTPLNGTLGIGEMRRITVPISLETNLLEGTYSIQIDASLDGAQYSARVALEVKK